MFWVDITRAPPPSLLGEENIGPLRGLRPQTGNVTGPRDSFLKTIEGWDGETGMNRSVDSHLLAAAEDVEARAAGYQTLVRQTASRIVSYERENRIRRISIKVKIDQELEKLARALLSASDSK